MQNLAGKVYGADQQNFDRSIVQVSLHFSQKLLGLSIEEDMFYARQPKPRVHTYARKKHIAIHILAKCGKPYTRIAIYLPLIYRHSQLYNSIDIIIPSSRYAKSSSARKPTSQIPAKRYLRGKKMMVVYCFQCHTYYPYRVLLYVYIYSYR